MTSKAFPVKMVRKLKERSTRKHWFDTLETSDFTGIFMTMK